MSPFQEWPFWLSYVNSSSSVVLYFSSLFMSSIVSSVHSVMSDSLWPHCHIGFPVHHQASLSITNSRSLLKLMSVELGMPSNHLILSCPLLLLPLVFPNIKVFSSESVVHIRWPRYWSFSPSNEYSGLISFIIEWFDPRVFSKYWRFSPSNEYSGLISFKIEWFDPRVFSNTTVQKHQFFIISFLYGPVLSSIHDYW